MKPKLLIFISFLLAVILLLHFVPIQTKNGFVESDGNCIGYPEPRVVHYRLILNGYTKYQDIQKDFNKEKSNTICGLKPVEARIFVL